MSTTGHVVPKKGSAPGAQAGNKRQERPTPSPNASNTGKNKKAEASVYSLVPITDILNSPAVPLDGSDPHGDPNPAAKKAQAGPESVARKDLVSQPHRALPPPIAHPGHPGTVHAGAQSERPANVNLDDHYPPFDKDGNVTASGSVPRGRDEELLSDALGNEHTRSQSDDESDPVGTYTMQDAAADAAPYWNLKMEEGSERLPSVILTLFSDPELKRKAQVRVKNEKPPVLKGDSEKVHREKKFSKNKLNLSVAKAKDEMRQMEGIMALDPKDKKLIKYLQSAISDHLAAKSKVFISVEFRSKGGSVKNPSFNYEVNVSVKSLRDKLFKMKQFL